MIDTWFRNINKSIGIRKKKIGIKKRTIEFKQPLEPAIPIDVENANNLISALTTKSRLSRDQVETMFKSCQIPQTRKEILEQIGYKNHSDNYKKYVELYVKEELITYLYPETPNSSKQKYVLTTKGAALLDLLITNKL